MTCAASACVCVGSEGHAAGKWDMFASLAERWSGLPARVTKHAASALCQCRFKLTAPPLNAPPTWKNNHLPGHRSGEAYVHQGIIVMNMGKVWRRGGDVYSIARYSFAM